MVSKRSLRVCVAAAVLLATAGCASSDGGVVASQPKRGTVGLSMPEKTSQRWVADGQNMVKQFKLLGYDTELTNAEDAQTQLTQVREMIKHGDDALVIAAVDGTILKPALAEAAAADIPVISYDRLIRDSPDVDYYATFDNFKVGVLQGNYLVDRLGLKSGKGPFSIEVFAGSPDDNNATFFYNGAMSVLKPYFQSGKLTVPSGETAFAKVGTLRWDSALATKRMSSLLAGPDADVQLDAILSPNDGIARGVIDALKKAGYGSASRPMPAITGQDAELDSVKLVAAGVQGQTVYKDLPELAKVAVQMTNSLLTGGTPEVNDTKQYNNGVKVVPTFLLQPVSVTKDNYQRVLVDGGAFTAAQIG